MTVTRDNGNIKDTAIGIVASSKHQAASYAPWASNTPKLDFDSPVGLEKIRAYMEANLGLNSSRWERKYLQFWASEQWTGHTALVVRRQGKVVWCRGWVPVPGWLNYANAFLRGTSVPGQWQDDTAMLDDPTCVSLELPCTLEVADALPTFWTGHNSAVRNYAFETTAEACNCVIAATRVLAAFLQARSLPDSDHFADITSPLQGRLMRQILSGTLLVAPT